ncbi:GlxA family transcriptional regulator [Azospirillum argentinense]
MPTPRPDMPDAPDRDAPSPADPRLRIGFVLLDQFTLTAFSGLIDALRLAADPGGRSRQIDASWTVMSVGGQPRQSSCGVLVTPNSDLLTPAPFDYVAVCGGNDYRNEVPGSVTAYLRAVAAQRVRLLGICTGTFAIARAGLVGTRRVCVHWNVLDTFRERFPAANASVDHLFIDEGDLITCAGSTAAIDLGLYLVGRHCGGQKARQAVRHMMLQDIRPGALPQAHFYANLDGVTDARVRQATHFIEQRLDSPPSVEAIARYVGVSARQLERSFQAALGISPSAFQRRLRLDYGRWLLEHTRRTITEIAFDCGFADAAHFSRDFKTQFGEMPSRARKGKGATESSPSPVEETPPL